MRSTRTTVLLGLALTVGLLAPPSAAEPLPAPLPEPVGTPVYGLLCQEEANDEKYGPDGDGTDNPGTWVTGGEAHYDRTVVTTGKKKKAVSTYSGVFDTHFALEAASCEGARFTITLTSVDGSPLGWTPGQATGTPTQVDEGWRVSTTWTGDGVTREYAVSGTTSDYTHICVRSTLQVQGPSGDERFTKTLETCDGGTGATSYR